jgi:hypothetical protein
VGCRRGHSPTQAILRCAFADSGFELADGRQARPCKSSYHPLCIRDGLLFSSRRNKSAGLVFPDISIWPTFVCEACTVHAVLGRELMGVDDWKLVCFE